MRLVSWSGDDVGILDDVGDHDGFTDGVPEGTDETVGTGDTEGKEEGHPLPNRAED